MKRADPFALAAALWALASLAWPDLKLSLGWLGGSPGSESTGLNLYLAEAFGAALGAWALLVPTRRRAIPRWAWFGAAGLALLLGAAALQGWVMGWHPRNIAAEARVLGLLPAFLGLLSLAPNERRVLAWGALGGAGLYALQQALLILLEPLGFTNLNIVPLPVISSSHDLALQSQMGVLVLLMGGTTLLLRRPRYLLVAAGLWALLWLSYLRALWVTMPLAALVGGLLLVRSQGWLTGMRYAAFQATAALLGLALCLGGLAWAHPDSAFLLRFRLERTAQALKLMPPPPLHPVVPASSSPVLKQGVQRGVLYTPLGTRLEPDANKIDPSGFDRGLMRRKAMEGFRSSPWLGQGLGALYSYQVAEGIGRLQRDPHSGFAWLLGKTGLLGVGLGLLGLGAVSAVLWRRRTPEAAALGAGLALGLLLEVFHCGLLQPASLLPLLALAAVARVDGA